nr:hypothetical protein BaRGS_013654 [Batillaria attramentaria]
MWDLLQRHRAGRTLMLSTHFMDEADALGNRIAIMADGKLVCCGSPMFLKKLYGTGYHLYIVKTKDCEEAKVTRFIQKAVPGAKFTKEMKAELFYLLPDDQLSRFVALFRALEARKEDLGILSFGASATTMEDVFLSRRMTTRQELGDPGYSKLTGKALLLSQLKAIVVKKALHVRRSPILSLVQILVPGLFTVMGLIPPTEEEEDDYLNNQKSRTTAPITFNLNGFTQSVVTYLAASSDAVTQGIAKQYGSQFDSAITVNKLDPSAGNMTAQLVERLPWINYNHIVGAEFLGTSNGVVSANVFFNGLTHNGAPIALNYLFNSLAMYYAPGHTITSGIRVFPNSSVDFSMPSKGAKEYKQPPSIGAQLTAWLPLGMSILMTMFIFILIKERSVGAKHMQMVSGLAPVVFWLGNLFFDFLVYLVSVGLIMGVFVAFDQPAFVEDYRLGLVLLILLLFGWAYLNFIYLSQFLFSTPASGVTALIIFTIFSGMILTFVMSVARLIAAFAGQGKNR